MCKGFAVAACVATLSVALCTPNAHALVPAGKATVSGPELLEIIKEDFIQRKYLVTGALTKTVRKLTLRNNT
jgi:hypothetical protein